MTSSLQLENANSWGVQAHGAELVINPGFYPVGPVLVIDVENNPDGSCAGIGFTTEGKTIYFFDKDTVSQWIPNKFARTKLVGHNAKYDVQMLRKWGFNVSPDQIIWDTQLAEYVVDSTKHRYGLKHLAQLFFGATYPDFKTLTGTGKKAVPVGSLPLDTVANYNGCDVLFTYKLYQQQLLSMSELQKQYLEEIELPTMRVILEMEERGVQIDADYIRGLDARFGDGVVRMAASIRDFAQTEINCNSHQQIKQLLMDKAGLRLKSTAAEELRNHASVPIVKDILRYRELAKLKNTYTAVLSKASNGASTYRLHARFNQSITATGRLSSSEPNLQNIPTRTEEGDLIRRGFIAKPDHVLLCKDYSQKEPRLMAHSSQDPALLKTFREGNSIYQAVIDALSLVEQYKGDKDEAKRVAKIMWLAMSYNAGAFKLSQQARITTHQATKFINRMRQVFGQFFYWKDKVTAQAEIDGGVTTLMGRFIPLPQDLAHLAPNYLVQGSASDIMKLAMQATREFSPVLSIHDELVFELHEKEAESALNEIGSRMEHVVELSVPLITSGGIAKNWGLAKS